MTNFTKLYSDLILKAIITRIARDQKVRAKHLETARINAEDYNSVRSQRHWKAVAGFELLNRTIDEDYKKLLELDQQSNWSNLLHQERFRFMEKYADVLEEYEKWYKGR